jgi:tetratricopeptide (TPR) repeat protein
MSRQYRTASEVFASIQTPGTTYLCQEFAYLFIALARASGLKAYYVFVEQDCYGDWNFHACPAVFVSGKAILIDPIYASFGIAQKKFTILDDLQTAAVHISAAGDLRLSQIAAKLAPSLAVVQASLFNDLISAGRNREAKAQLAIMERVHPAGPMPHYASAVIDLQEGNTQHAIEKLRRAVEMAPQTDLFYATLGFAYSQQGKLNQALDAYRDALRYAKHERAAKLSREAIDRISQTAAREYYASGFAEQTKGDWGAAFTNYDKAVALGPACAEAYFGRGTANHARGNLDAALADYDKAINLDPTLAEAYCNRGIARQHGGDLIGAATDYDKAIELKPGLPEICENRGYLNYSLHRFSEALSDFRRACTLGSTSDNVRFRIWLTRSQLGETKDATEELRQYLDRRKREGVAVRKLKVGLFLAGLVGEPELIDSDGDQNLHEATESQCQAFFYSGSNRLLSGDKTTAIRYFERCVAMNLRTLPEYESAKTELHLLVPTN